MDEFELSEELTTSLENTVRENTGFVSLDSVYPVPYSSEPSYAVDVDGVFFVYCNSNNCGDCWNCSGTSYDKVV